jgi:hypothetical protein
MSDVLQVFAQTIRDELETRLEAWKVEREALMGAQLRIDQLSALIAVAEDDMLRMLPVAPRPKPRELPEPGPVVASPITVEPR